MEELFSAAKSEFRHLQPFYFHNCLYEGLWRDNARRCPTRPHLGCAAYLWSRLESDLRRRRRNEPLRDHSSRWPRMSTGTRKQRGLVARAVGQWPHHLWINPVPEQGGAIPGQLR